MKNRWLMVLPGLLLITLASLNARALEPVRLQLKWTHQFQFAGYYMAKELGIYESAGLDVTIIEAEPGMQPVDQVLDGYADIGIGTTDLVRYRSEGKPVVVLGVIFQHSPMAIAVARAETPYTIHDLARMPLMIEPHAAELWVYFKNEGLDLNKIQVVEHSLGVEDLVAGKVGGMSVYTTTEPFELKQKHFEYQLFNPRAAGIDFYGDNIFTSERFLEENPEVAQAFLKASVSGWKYALSHVDETIAIIHNRYSQRLSREHLQFEAEEMRKLINPDIVEPGYMNHARWEYIIDTYMQLGMIKKRPDLDGFLYEQAVDQDNSSYYLLILVVSAIVMALTALLTRFIWVTWRLRKEIEYRATIEDALRQSSEKLDVAKTEAENANAFKSKFLASISHDLRTPLTAVIGFSEQAVLDAGKGEDIGRSLGLVLNNARYIQEIIDELSDIAQIESGTLQLKPVMLDLLPLIGELEVIFTQRAQAKHIGYRTVLHWPLPAQLYLDATRFRRALLNLLSNAIKFTDNGTVTLEVSANEAYLLCKVVDTGRGIDESDLGQLFKPFVQARGNIKANYGGTGLGLYITRSFIESMQGVIGVDSRPGNGSCFYFRVPIGIDKPAMLTEGQQPIASVAAVAAPERQMQGRLLVAEDVADNRELLGLMLNVPGLQLTFAHDGQQALQAIAENAYDLVLMDIQMPVMSGLEAIHELRRQGNFIPVIALSANVAQVQIDEYLQAGFDGVLPKPVDRRSMFRLLGEYLAVDAGYAGPLDDQPVSAAAYDKSREKLAALLPVLLAELEAYLAGSDYTALAQAAHRYIGSSGMLGWEDVSNALARLEDAARVSDRNACAECLQRLKVAISRL